MNRAHFALLIALGAAVGAACVSDKIDPYHLDVLIGVGINVLLAVSLNLINGHTGQFSLGHAGFMGVGAYTAAALTMFLAPGFFAFFGGETPLLVHTFFGAALIAGGLFAALAGFFVGVPSLRLRGDYLAIVTLGFGEIIRVIMRNVEPLGGALGLSGIPPYTTLFWTFGAVAICIYVVGSMVNSTYGRGFIAVADDEIAAEASGINTTRFKILAFVVGAFFAGVAGGLYGHFKMFIEPRGFDYVRSIEIVVMVVLGGMGNTVGVIIAAVLLTLLPEVLRGAEDYRMIIYSAVLIALMLLKPTGLFPAHWGKFFHRKKSASAKS